MHMLSFRQGMPLGRWYLRYLGALGSTGYQGFHGFHGSTGYNSAWLPQVPMGITTTVSGYNGMWVPLQRHQFWRAKGANVPHPPLFCQKAIYHFKTPNATFGLFLKNFPQGHGPITPKNENSDWRGSAAPMKMALPSPHFKNRTRELHTPKKYFHLFWEKYATSLQKEKKVD